MIAAVDLVRRVGGVPLECLVVIELPELGGRKRLLPLPTHAVFTY
jgi:adenine/guanine phosphoribosyltransferase-like PRPP-binding protein